MPWENRQWGSRDKSYYKTVLVIDEAQDMTEDEFALVEALIRKMRT